MTTREKYDRLKEKLRELTRTDACLAFSGGVDSALLLTAASRAAKENGTQLWAVTFDTELHPRADVRLAQKLAAEAGVLHEILRVRELENTEICSNPPERCYLCKRYLFGKLRAFAEEKGITSLMEGTNADDLGQYRPGLRAVRELGIRSPLADCGITKAEVRSLSAMLGISVAERPSTPCMATRLPYGAQITAEILEHIEKGEELIKSLGYRNVRLRVHGDLARIEVDREDIPRAALQAQKLSEAVRALGFDYVTLDLSGFRSGSMDERLLARRAGGVEKKAE